MSVSLAVTWTQRHLGLIGLKELLPGQALIIKNCRRVHTWFMRFPIDLVFVDNQGVVVKIFTNLKPWRVTPRVALAAHCIELPRGEVTRLKIYHGRRCLIDIC